MREIIPKRLWIGHAQDARDVRSVLDLGIRAVIDLAIVELPVRYPREIVYCRFPLNDGLGNEDAVLRAAISTTRLFVETSMPTLVSCSAGMSRSPAIVAAALAEIRKMDLDTALLEVASGEPHDVSLALWSDIRKVVAGPQ